MGSIHLNYMIIQHYFNMSISSGKILQEKDCSEFCHIPKVALNWVHGANSLRYRSSHSDRREIAKQETSRTSNWIMLWIIGNFQSSSQSYVFIVTFPVLEDSQHNCCYFLLPVCFMICHLAKMTNMRANSVAQPIVRYNTLRHIASWTNIGS
jgi:hypothetical protein